MGAREEARGSGRGPGNLTSLTTSLEPEHKSLHLSVRNVSMELIYRSSELDK